MYETRTIIRNSLPTICVTTAIGIVAGIVLNSIEQMLYTIPFLITVIPAINNMVGSFSCIVTSNVSTLFKTRRKKQVKKLFAHAFTAAILSSLYLALVGWIINPSMSILTAIGLVVGTCFFLIVIICALAYLLTVFLLKRKIDPDDVIIPIATAVADVFAILVFSLLVRVLI